jgi:hypothetical protein
MTPIFAGLKTFSSALHQTDCDHAALSGVNHDKTARPELIDHDAVTARSP